MHKFLFYSKSIIFLCVFRALCAHHEEVKIVLYSIWYSEVCQPRCVFKLYGEVNSVNSTTINVWLNDGVYLNITAWLMHIIYNTYSKKVVKTC